MAVGISVAAGANAGSTPPVPVLSNFANDERGSITCGTGTTATAGAQAVLTFSGSWSGYTNIASPIPTVTPLNAATAAIGPWYATVSSDNRTLTLGCAGIPASSQPSNVYALGYSLSG